MQEFNINKMLQWDSKNALMYTRYVHKNFEDPPVLMNIMMTLMANVIMATNAMITTNATTTITTRML